MKLTEVRRNAFAMPLNDPAYPPGPYKFYNREFVVITYRTDIEKLRTVVPEPLEVAGETVARPNFMLKIIPHVDCTPRICELVRYYMEDVTVKGAWAGPAAIQLFEHALCDVARLPVREVVSATHYVTDLTLGLGEVVFDYLKHA